MRILVVEGDPELARVLQRGLETERYVVDVARSRSDGLLRITSTAYDLLILDLVLFGGDAPELLRSFRADGNVAGIIALIDRREVEDRNRILDHGADECVTRPFSLVELLARVRALARRLPETVDTLIVGDLAVDIVRRSATSSGQRIALTPREYELLAVLVRHPGATVTREVLAQRVWGTDLNSSSNVIKLFVGYLRRKLSDAGSTCRIVTVRGAGYVFEPSKGPPAHGEQ